MTKLPRLTGKQVIKALQRTGFKVIRIKGSHHFLQHDDDRCTTVPVHANEVIGPGLLIKILNDCEMSREDLMEFL